MRLNIFFLKVFKYDRYNQSCIIGLQQKIKGENKSTTAI